METLKIAVIGQDASSLEKLKEALSGEGVKSIGSYSAAQAEKVVNQRPDAVIFLAEEGAFDLASRIYESLPGCPMLLAGANTGVEAMSRAMQAGMRGFLSPNDPPEKILGDIRLAVSAERARAKSAGRPLFTRGTVIVVFSGKGGVGKTTLTVNLAAALAKAGKRTAILDGDLQFGDAALMFDLEPKDTIAELAQEQGTPDADTVKSFCMLHHSGVHVLCAPKSPECAEYISVRNIEAILGVMRASFDFILVDTPPSFNDTTLAAIECADTVLLVAGVDISTLKNARACAATFATLQQKEKLRVVVNGEQPSMITVKDVERILEMPVYARIAADHKTALDCLNRGTPAVCAVPRSRLACEISLLAKKLTEEKS